MIYSNYLLTGRKHHELPTFFDLISPLFSRSRSFFFTYSALPSSSSATSEAGIVALSRHFSKAFINFSSVYFGSNVINLLQRKWISSYICVVSYIGHRTLYSGYKTRYKYYVVSIRYRGF